MYCVTSKKCELIL